MKEGGEQAERGRGKLSSGPWEGPAWSSGRLWVLASGGLGTPPLHSNHTSLREASERSCLSLCSTHTHLCDRHFRGGEEREAFPGEETQNRKQHDIAGAVPLRCVLLPSNAFPPPHPIPQAPPHGGCGLIARPMKEA